MTDNFLGSPNFQGNSTIEFPNPATPGLDLEIHSLAPGLRKFTQCTLVHCVMLSRPSSSVNVGESKVELEEGKAASDKNEVHSTAVLAKPLVAIVGGKDDVESSRALSSQSAKYSSSFERKG
jgi:hypothetical protein